MTNFRIGEQITGFLLLGMVAGEGCGRGHEQATWVILVVFVILTVEVDTLTYTFDKIV